MKGGWSTGESDVVIEVSRRRSKQVELITVIVRGRQTERTKTNLQGQDKAGIITA